MALVKKYGPEPEDPYYDEDSEDDDDETLEAGIASMTLGGDNNDTSSYLAPKRPGALGHDFHN